MTTAFPPTFAGLLLFSLSASTAAFLLGAVVSTRQRSPETRHLTWLLCFLASALCLGLGSLRWEVPIHVLHSSMPPAVAASAAPIAPASLPAVTQASPLRPSRQTEVSVLLPVAAALSPAKGAPASHSASTVLIALLWTSGACITLLPVVLGALRWHTLCRDSANCTDPTIQSICLSLTAGSRPPPRLLVSRTISSPMLGGLIHPCIVLPAEAAEWSGFQCESALRHEMAHHRRHDLPAFLFCRIMAAIFWFQPLAWIALRRLRLEAEMAADDATVSSFRPDAATAYAEALLMFCRRSSARPLHLGIASSIPMQARLQRILDPLADRTPLSRRRVILVTAAVLVVAVSLSLLKPVAADPGPALLRQIVEANQTTWARVESMSYLERDTRSGDRTSRFQMEWWEMGKKCLYRYREFDDLGGVHFGFTYAYDGKTARHITLDDPGKGIMTRTTTPRAFDDWVIYRSTPTSPLDFLTLTRQDSITTTNPLELIRDPANWDRFLAEAQVLGREPFQGRECIVVKVRGRYLRNTVSGEGSGDYLVYFDPARAYRPAGWKACLPDGTFFQELIVSREEEIHGPGGARITLPREIQVNYCSDSWLATFSDFSINSLSSFPFTLDETQAGLIGDKDSGQISKAPIQPYLATVLPDMEFTDLPIDQLYRHLQDSLAPHHIGIMLVVAASHPLPVLSLRMKKPTLGALLTEIQKQVKDLQVETNPREIILKYRP